MNLAARAAAWSARHPLKAIAGWLALLVVAVALGQVVKLDTLSAVQSGNGDSQRADQLVQQHFPQYAREQVLVQSRGGATIEDPAFATAVRDVLRRLDGV